MTSRTAIHWPFSRLRWSNTYTFIGCTESHLHSRIRSDFATRLARIHHVTHTHSPRYITRTNLTHIYWDAVATPLSFACNYRFLIISCFPRSQRQTIKMQQPSEICIHEAVTAHQRECHSANVSVCHCTCWRAECWLCRRRSTNNGKKHSFRVALVVMRCTNRTNWDKFCARIIIVTPRHMPTRHMPHTTPFTAFIFWRLIATNRWEWIWMWMAYALI